MTRCIVGKLKHYENIEKKEKTENWKWNIIGAIQNNEQKDR